MGCQGPSIQSSSLDGNDKWAILDITNQHQGAIVAQHLEGFWAAFRRITTVEVHEHTNCCLDMGSLQFWKPCRLFSSVDSHI